MQRIMIIALILAMLTGCAFLGETPERVGLIPLDSRPCNTQYPDLLGKMANKHLEIPYDYLDDFLDPAQTEELWSWLESNSKSFDKIIINTNELINGGLIASRHAQSYKDLNEKMARLTTFLQKNKKKEIIVITILPRLLPSQFTQLWSYQESLVQYAQKIDQYFFEGKKLPNPPKDVPYNILEEYLSIYENTQVLVENLITLTNQGLIDHYLIGQDDAQQYGLSNKIIRELTPSLSEKIQFVHGADELTMLALTRRLQFKNKLSLHIDYTNEDFKDAYFPFEAAPLEKVVQTKLHYLQIEEDKNSPNNVIIHSDLQKVDKLKALVEKSPAAYLGIMDVACTNKGDIALFEFLLQPEIWAKVDSYAGWNTAGNTIGTELAHRVSYKYLSENIKNYNKPVRADALRAYLEFRYIRMAEDLVFQGILREGLNERLKKLSIDPHNIGENHQQANEILTQLFAPYEQTLAQAFLGDYTIGNVTFTVENVSAQIELPWSRTFEAKVTPEFAIH